MNGADGESPVHGVTLGHPADAAGWREAARALLRAGVAPEHTVWCGEPGTADLFGTPDGGADGPSCGEGGRGELPGRGTTDEPYAVSPRVPRAFLPLAERVVCHREPARFALLYRVLWRLTHGEPGLLSRASDPDVYRLHRLERAVSREVHKLHAFVRFRRVADAEPETYVAWIEPEHHTLRFASGFFRRRFATMRFSILTPAESVHWDTRELVFGPGGRPAATSADGACGHGTGHPLPPGDGVEALWRTYYANIFNPARLRTDAMRAEMPVKFWKNLPEASLIEPLVREAEARTGVMIDRVPRPPPRFATGRAMSTRGPGRASTGASGASGASNGTSTGVPTRRGEPVGKTRS